MQTEEKDTQLSTTTSPWKTTSFGIGDYVHASNHTPYFVYAIQTNVARPGYSRLMVCTDTYSLQATDAQSTIFSAVVLACSPARVKYTGSTVVLPTQQAFFLHRIQDPADERDAEMLRSVYRLVQDYETRMFSWVDGVNRKLSRISDLVLELNFAPI